MLGLPRNPSQLLSVLGGLMLAAAAAARLSEFEVPTTPPELGTHSLKSAPPEGTEHSWPVPRNAETTATPESSILPPMAVECRHGGLLIRDATGPVRWRPLWSVEPVRIPLAPVLERAESIRRSPGQPAPPWAEPLYREVAESAADGRSPEWAGVVAQTRRLELAIWAGDVGGVAQFAEWLARQRPKEAVAFLPPRVTLRGPHTHDQAVRLWQSRVCELLQSDPVGYATEVGTLLGLLARLDCDLPDTNAADRLTPFGQAPHAGEAVIWVLDPASFNPTDWAAVRARLSAAVWRLSGRVGHRFALLAGPGVRDRFPPAGFSPVDTAAQRAAEGFLTELAGARCGPAVSPGAWSATLRRLDQEAAVHASRSVMVVLLTRCVGGVAVRLPRSWSLRWGVV